MAPQPAPRRTASGVRRQLRRATVAIAFLTAAAVLTSGAPVAATADPTTPGSASATSATVVAGSGITMTSTGTGLLGTLTAPLSGLVGTVGTLTSSVSSVATNALTSTAGLQATSGSTQQPRPTPVANYPVCNQTGWVSPNGNCYAVVPTTVTPTLANTALVALSAGTVQGYATGDDQGYVGAAGSSHPILVVPGLTIDLGIASSDALCGTASCTPEHAFTGGTITTTAGTQSFALASGQTLASVGGTSISNGATVPVVPSVISATASGTLLTLTVSLTLAQFLTVAGTTLSALNAGLTGVLGDNGSTINLSVTIGPGDITATSGTTASAWGLEVGINLYADIKLSLRALLLSGLLGNVTGTTELVNSGATSYPATNGSKPNLVDLKFAYSAATAGLLLPGWLPTALI